MRPMPSLALAEHRTSVPVGPGWAYELKYEGYRVLIGKDETRSFVRYRSGYDASASFPEVIEALRELPCRTCLLDGEVVVFDDHGKPNIRRLRTHRAHATRRINVAFARKAHPATAMAFDVLELDGVDMRPLPWTERNAALAGLAPRTGAVRYVDHVIGRGQAFFDLVCASGLEGVVAKRIDAPYVAGRNPNFVKVYCDPDKKPFEEAA